MEMKLRKSFHLIVLGSLVLGGCSLMPASGPESWDVKTGQRDPQSLPYALVKVTPAVTATTSSGRCTLSHRRRLSELFEPERQNNGLDSYYFAEAPCVTGGAASAKAGAQRARSSRRARPDRSLYHRSERTRALGAVDRSLRASCR